MTNKLHKIFSETGCLSEEVLQKYLKDELAKKEKHLVEKHLIDCEICSDVLEGMSLVGDFKSVAPIFAEINSEIKSHIEKPKPKSRVIKLNSWLPYVAAAAVILFVVSFFYLKPDLNENQTIVAEKSIKFEGEETLTIEDESKQNTKKLDVEESTGNKSQELNDKEITTELVIVEDAIDADIELDLSVEADDESEIEEEPALAEVTVTAADANYGTYSPVALETISISTENQGSTTKDLVKISENNNEVYTQTSSSKMYTSKTQIEKKGRIKKEKLPKNKCQKAESTKAVTIGESKNKEVSITKYSNDAENEYTPTSDSLISNNAVQLDYRTNTYNLAFTNYSANKFTIAVGLFNQVLSDSINHYNSLYYGAVSYYQLNKNDSALIYFNKVLEVEKGVFHEDAMWHKVLILKRTKQIPETKLLLQSIINENGKWKTHAEEMLKRLN